MRDIQINDGLCLRYINLALAQLGILGVINYMDDKILSLFMRYVRNLMRVKSRVENAQFEHAQNQSEVDKCFSNILGFEEGTDFLALAAILYVHDLVKDKSPDHWFED